MTAEVTPHHLLLTDEALLGYDTFCKVNPPIREEQDREALMEALKDGTIDCIATDHAPHSSIEKDCEFAAASPGLIGLETTFGALLALVRDGWLTPLRLMEALSTAPARVGRLPGGSLREGETADLVLLDPELRWRISREALRSRSHNTPLLGREVQGAVAMTLVGGEVVYER